MSLKLKIINPLNYAGWDDLVLSTQKYSFFHSSSWAKVLYESYKYNPLYFTLINNERLSVLIPIMEIKSKITGRRGISLPFSDYCDPIILDRDIFHDILDELIQYGEKSKWKYLELRIRNDSTIDLPPSYNYYIHTLDILKNEDQILSTFHRTTKGNIKRAIRDGVKVKICKSLESIREFYHLNCLTRKRHGLPPQPFYFFKQIYNHIILKNSGFVILAYYENKIISGGVFFHFGEKAVYKYGASDRAYIKLRANHLILWEAIKWYAQNGFRSFCFGKTDPENTGLRQFKTGWGTIESTINYNKYDFKKTAFIQDNSIVKGSHNKVFNKFPIPLLKLTGKLLYRHIG